MSAQSVGEIGLDLVVNKNGFDRQMSGIQKQARKAGAALAAAFAVKKIAAFGKQCLELGSDLAEVQNVVDVTFASMSGKIDKFAKKAVQSAGLSETMAKQYTGTFGAMAKSFGFVEKDAYAMSTALTQLAGDVASFYNLSQDEAYTKLKSVFTGETETLKDLGVVMTQTALDQYALSNGIGKTVQEMTEYEKVALRYKFVTEQLSGASGDFLRTSDGWANQVRILKLQFDSLKATLGQGLINVFTPVIKAVNALLGRLAVLAEAFKSFTELITGSKSSGAGGISALSGAAAETSEGLSDAAGSADNLADNTSGVGKAAKKAAKEMRALMGFDQISRLAEPSGDDSDDKDKGSSGSIPAIQGSPVDYGALAEGETVLDKLGGKFQGLISRAKELASLFKKGFEIGFGDSGTKIASIKKHLQGIGKSLKEIFTDPQVVKAAEGLMDSIALNAGKMAGAFASIGLAIADNLVGGFDKYLQNSKDYIKERLISIFDVSSDIADQIGDFSVVLADILEVFRSDAAKQITASIIGIFSDGFFGALDLGLKLGRDIIYVITQPVIENKDKLKEALENTLEPISTVLDSLHGVVKNTFEKIHQVYDEHLAPAFEHIKNGFSTVFAAALDAYNEYLAPVLDWIAERFSALVSDYIQPLIDAFLEFSAKAIEALSIFWEFISPFVAWFVEKFIAQLATKIQWLWTKFEFVFSALSAIVQRFLEVLSGIIDFLIGVFTGDWERAWNGVKEIFGGILNGIYGVAKAVWNLIKNTIETAVNAIKSTIQVVFSGIKTLVSGVWNVIKNVTKTAWEAVQKFISDPIGNIKRVVNEGLEAVRNKFSTALSPIKDTVSGIFNGLWNTIRGVCNSILGGTENLANGVINAVNSIANAFNNMSFSIPDWVPFYGGGTLGFSLPTFSNVSLPRLAQGGFVKKNTPQLAMIGDNRHQGEVVAPEGKLQEMVDAAVRAAGSGITRQELEGIIDGAVLRIVAALEQLGFYVDSEELARAVRKGERRRDMRYNPVMFN